MIGRPSQWATSLGQVAERGKNKSFVKIKDLQPFPIIPRIGSTVTAKPQGTPRTVRTLATRLALTATNLISVYLQAWLISWHIATEY